MRIWKTVYSQPDAADVQAVSDICNCQLRESGNRTRDRQLRIMTLGKFDFEIGVIQWGSPNRTAQNNAINRDVHLSGEFIQSV